MAPPTSPTSWSSTRPRADRPGRTAALVWPAPPPGYGLEQFQLAYNAHWLDRGRELQVDDPKIREGMIKALDAYTLIWRKGCTPPDAVFRDLLTFSIGFIIERNRPLLRRILKEHVADDTRQLLAKKVVEHLELSGFEIDEERQVMTKKPPTHGHG